MIRSMLIGGLIGFVSGTYVAVVARNTNMPLWASLPIAMIAGAISSWVYVTFKRRRDGE